MPDSPTLRELVDMLPGEMQKHQACVRIAHGVMIEGDDDRLLGYLVRWLLDRGWIIRKSERHYIAESDHIVLSGFDTPIEAAVRAVGVVHNSKDGDTHAGTTAG